MGESSAAVGGRRAFGSVVEPASCCRDKPRRSIGRMLLRFLSHVAPPHRGFEEPPPSVAVERRLCEALTLLGLAAIDFWSSGHYIRSQCVLAAQTTAANAWTWPVKDTASQPGIRVGFATCRRCDGRYAYLPFLCAAQRTPPRGALAEAVRVRGRGVSLVVRCSRSRQRRHQRRRWRSEHGERAARADQHPD